MAGVSQRAPLRVGFRMELDGGDHPWGLERMLRDGEPCAECWEGLSLGPLGQFGDLELGWRTPWF